ncbi:hypothetical protein GDO78_015916 [Eleutherodactylus coqui]|uniref:Uncharacterized protein n=1 Tax=Eleutherodactylus coqui TaxID=57060 RepID=A0A8J6E686_ELECQ|nr:hypothetical protein GDO78_015916 [Eleutherodactylus coqui]
MKTGNKAQCVKNTLGSTKLVRETLKQLHQDLKLSLIHRMGHNGMIVAYPTAVTPTDSKNRGPNGSCIHGVEVLHTCQFPAFLLKSIEWQCACTNSTSFMWGPSEPLFSGLVGSQQPDPY